MTILVVKLRYIGDVLLATPVFRALKAGIPGVRLVAAVPRDAAPVLHRHPDVDDVVEVERGTWRSQAALLTDLRKRRFDCVIDLTDADRSAIMSALTGAPRRIGFNWEHYWRGLLYTDVVVHDERRHRIERDLEAVRPLGLVPVSSPPALYLTAEEHAAAERLLDVTLPGWRDTSYVVMHPGARYWFKSWPADRFAALARRCIESLQCSVVIAGGTQDVSTAEEIAKLAGSRAVSLAGRVDLRGFAAVATRARLFVGNDTGAMHIAAAMGAPVLALFGPSDPVQWRPIGDRVTVLYKGVDCRPCYHPTCRRGEQSCMRQISVEEVMDVVRRMWEGTPCRS